MDAPATTAPSIPRHMLNFGKQESAPMDLARLGGTKDAAHQHNSTCSSSSTSASNTTTTGVDADHRSSSHEDLPLSESKRVSFDIFQVEVRYAKEEPTISMARAASEQPRYSPPAEPSKH